MNAICENLTINAMCEKLTINTMYGNVSNKP